MTSRIYDATGEHIAGVVHAEERRTGLGLVADKIAGGRGVGDAVGGNERDTIPVLQNTQHRVGRSRPDADVAGVLLNYELICSYCKPAC